LSIKYRNLSLASQMSGLGSKRSVRLNRAETSKEESAYEKDASATGDPAHAIYRDI